MSQGISVTRKEHVNGTFDIIYENTVKGDEPDDVYTLVNAKWLNLFTAIVAGVAANIHGNKYRDPEDQIKGQKFLASVDMYDETVESEHYPTMGTVTVLFDTMGGDLISDLASIIKTIHISGSIFANQDTTQLRGLVTITYLDPGTEQLQKVRLSGLLDENVGLALRAPYVRALEDETLVNIAAPKKEEFEKKPATQPADKFKGQLTLSREQMEELSEMVAYKLASAFVHNHSAPRKVRNK